MKPRKACDFHFIKLDGMTDQTLASAHVAEHKELNLNRSSIMKLMSASQGQPLGEAVQGLPPERPAVPLPIDMDTDPGNSPAQCLEMESESTPVPLNIEAVQVEEILLAPVEDYRERFVPLPTVAAEEPTPMPKPLSKPTTVIEESPSLELAPEHSVQPDDMAIEEAPEAVAPLPPPALPTVAVQPPTLPLTDPAATTARSTDSPAQPSASSSSATGLEGTDHVLLDVQATLSALADMAGNLGQQKIDTERRESNLDSREAAARDKERQLTEREEQLHALEARLYQQQAEQERTYAAQCNAQTERGAALKTVADNLESRERAYAKRVETLQHEQRATEELAAQLVERADVLVSREAEVTRKKENLDEQLKELSAAREKLHNLVKVFNETVQFNNTLNAIGSRALDPARE